MPITTILSIFQIFAAAEPELAQLFSDLIGAFGTLKAAGQSPQTAQTSLSAAIKQTAAVPRA